MRALDSRQRERVRRGLLAALVAGSAAACGAEFRAGHETATDGGGDASIEVDSGAPTAEDGGIVLVVPPDTGVDAGHFISVAGHAMAAPTLPDQAQNPNYDPTCITASSVPLAARHVALLDANGVRTDLTTDANGAFSVDHVAVPYDAVVFAASATTWPIVYTSLTTPHPRLGGKPEDGGAPLPSEAPVAVPLNVPLECGACGVDTTSYEQCGTCYVTLGAVAPGQKTLMQYYLPSAKVEVYSPGDGGMGWISTGLQWTGPTPTSAALDVIVDNQAADGGTFFGETTEAFTWDGGAGFIFAEGIPLVSIRPLGVTSIDVGAPLGTGYAPRVFYSLLNLPSGNSLPLKVAGDASTAATADVYALDGGTLSAFLMEINTDSEAVAFAQGLPESTPTIPLQALGAPTFSFAAAQAPTVGQIVWAKPSPAEEEVLAVSLIKGPSLPTGTECEVLTSGTSIDLARLAQLGVTVDTSVVQLAMYGYGQISSLDALVDEGTLAVPDGTHECDERLNFSFPDAGPDAE